MSTVPADSHRTPMTAAWIDRNGKRLQLTVHFPDTPDEDTRREWRVDVGEPGQAPYLSVKTWLSDMDVSYLGMRSDDPTHDERECELLGALVGGAKQAAFLRSSSGQTEVRLVAPATNPLGLHVEADSAVPCRTPPRFYFEKNPEYEMLLAQTIRNEVLVALQPHYKSNLDYASLYHTIPVDADMVDAEVEWLVEHGYVAYRTTSVGQASRILAITDTGAGLLRLPAETRWPALPGTSPAHVNVVSVGQMTNSQVQQAGSSATLVATFDMSRAQDLSDAVDELSSRSGELDLQSEKLRELQAELTTLKVQLSSPRPKPAIIAEAVRAVRDILTGAAGGLAASLAARWLGLTP